MSDPSSIIKRLLAWRGSWANFRPHDLPVLAKAIERGVLEQSSPDVVLEFEKQFAAFCDVRHGVAFCNGTMAISTALRAVGVGPGDEVLMADYGFHGMAAAILALGATVVPCDIDPQSLCLDPNDIAAACGPRTRAILVHNPWGLPADYRAIREAASSRDLAIVADASHAHGAHYCDKPIGQWTDITCYSLGLQKLISGGELGFAGTSSPQLRDRLFILSQTNRVAKNLLTEQWPGNAVGIKGRAHPMAAALALEQLRRFPEKLIKLRETCRQLESQFQRLGFEPQSASWPVDRVYWRIVLRARSRMWTDLRKIETIFRNVGIPLEPNPYKPALQHQALFDWPGHSSQIRRRECPITETTLAELLTLPAPVQFDSLLANEIFVDLEDALRPLGVAVSG